MPEHHHLKPFLPANAKVMFLGSFPPPKKRWCMDFFYPNFARGFDIVSFAFILKGVSLGFRQKSGSLSADV